MNGVWEVRSGEYRGGVWGGVKWVFCGIFATV